MQVEAWVLHRPGADLIKESRREVPGPGDVIVRVAGCGVCHTDLGFHFDAVPTRHPLPLTLGHEISGTVVEAGPGAEAWLQRTVIVPAVIPCGTCAACRAGRGSICPRQVFPGNDVHGGFASHLRVPAHGLCPVPDLRDPRRNPSGLDLASLSVLADAVTTPFQAIARSGLQAGDLAVFVGVGGVGGFGVQIARARGAVVVAIDVDAARLQAMTLHGASLALNPGSLDLKALRAAIRELAEQRRIPTWRWRIFETSGTPAGQALAFALLAHGSYLSVIGFTPQKVELRFSNLMAYDATAQGNWGCLPELYPAALDLVLSGRVTLAPFIERRPLSSINETLHDLHEHRISRRVVLLPEA